ncbi:MAG: hypothetical protein Fur0035_08220 [Anaerolineales bacterium]
MNTPLTETSLRLWFKASGIALTAAALTTFPAAASPLRLALAALTLLAGLTILVLGFLPAISPTLTTLSAWLSRPAWILAAAAELTLFSALALTPAEQTGRLYYYFLAALPFFYWVIFTDFSLLLLIFLAQKPDLRVLWQNHKTALMAGALSLLTLILLTLFTLNFQGTSYEDYWYGAGVPLLAGQVFLAFLLGLAALALPKTWRSAALFALIWLIAAALWAREPVRASFFVTRPLPPNGEFYPYADPSVFDINSQYALIGQGLNNGVFYDRALYPFFLTLLHTFFGQNYQTLMAAQAALFAILAALLFLIGEKIHSRAAGIILAALITLRGLNSIAASAWIDTSAPKHMLTDFPTALGLAVFTLLVLHWLEKPSARWPFFGWAAGALAFSSLLRPHVMLLAAPLLALALWRGSRQRLALLAFGLIAFSASIGPWAFFGGDVSLIDLYRSRIESVINERYRPAPPAPEPSPLTPESSAPGFHLAAVKPAPTFAPQNEPPFPVRHFAHNLLTSALIFPTSPQFFTLKEVLRGGDPFWDEAWRGEMTAAQAGWLTLSLLILALGSGAAFAKSGWRGLLPWGVFFTYAAANSLARTSGGRYLVPMDWLPLLYFALGLAEIPHLALGLLKRQPALRGESLAPAGQKSAAWQMRAAGTILTLGLLGGLLPLSNHLYPVRYTKDENTLRQAAAQVLGAQQVETFLAQPGALILEGRALYPRFLKSGQYLPLTSEEILPQPYGRLMFTLIGPQGQREIFIRDLMEEVLPNGADVLAIGCKVERPYFVGMEALAVILPSGQAILRQPGAPLLCEAP